jgi:two-component sensor histidine kinase
VTTEEKPHRRLSLRVLLLLIFAAALSPVLVIGGIRWSGDVEREAHYRRETMRLVAQVAASNADSVLKSAPATLQLLASGGSATPANVCRLPLASIVDALPGFENLGVVDAEGRLVCASLEEAVGLSVTDRDWFKALSSGPATYIQSAALISPITNAWMIASAQRLETGDGQFNGGIVLGTPVSVLLAQLQHSSLPEAYELALVDGAGRVFSSAFWDHLDVKTMDALWPGAANFQLQGSDNRMRDAAVVRLDSNELYVLVSAPPPPPIGLENVSAFGSFALPLLAWLLALVTAWLAMDRLVLRWLDYLRRIATLYASGKLTVQPLRAKRQAPIEINSLADTMEEMATRIRDRTVRMENALEARDAAMKEIHHRVKNNLQIINSLLSLQGRKLQDPAAKSVLDDARARINALSLIHRSLYEHNNISAVETRSFLSELAAHLDQALGAEERGIKIESAVDEDHIEADLAVPLALFTAEAVTNSVKHAFPTAHPGGGGGRILVSYRAYAAETILSVEDDGVGYEAVAAASAAGIGATLMSAFAKQVGGVLEEGPIDGGVGRYIRIRISRAIGVDRKPAPATAPEGVTPAIAAPATGS